MLVTSDEIKAAWLKPSRQLSIRVNINGTTYGSEDITSLSFDSGSISGETYQIGSTYMNSVKIVFPSIIESIKEDIEVIPELAILLEGEYQYTKLGHFFVSEFDRDRNSNKTTITANDKMMYMESAFESRLTYPKPYKEVALEIANLSGVEVNQASFSSLGISSIAKPEGYTYRQAIGLIAQFEGGFASFNRDGELEIRRLVPTSFEVTPESYLLKGFTKNEVSYRIGGISVKTGEEETDVIRVGSLNGSQVILENKVMTQSLLDIMWDLVKDINYFPYELKWRGCPPLEAGDWFYVEDKDGKRYSVPNLSYSMTFNGGLSAESKATTNSSSQATYKYRGPLSQRVDYLDSILSANKWNSNYYDQTEPTNPKEGDIWFKPNGQDTEIWVYRNVDGNLKWVMEITSAGDPELAQAIEEAKQAGEQAKEVAEQAKLDAESAQSKADAIRIDVNGLVSDVTTINGTVNSISSKANEAYNKASAVEGRTATLETSVTGLTGRITDIESTATSTTKKLNELVVTVDGQKQTIATVTTTANSALSKANVLESTVDGVTQTLTSVESTISNVGSSGTNLLINGGFENDFFGWDSTSSVHKIDTSEKHTGRKSLMINAAGSVKMINLNVKIPVYQGQQLEFSMWYKTTSDFDGISNNNKFRVGKQDGSLLVSYGWDGAVTEWTNRVATLTVGAGITELTIRIDSTHSKGIVWWDDISIVDVTGRNQTNSKINQITDTVDGHTQLIASTKTTADSALTKATQVETTANGLKTTISSVETTANSALTKATQVEATADSLVYTVNRINGGGTNLVSNGGFENDYVGWTQPSGFTITTSESHSGSKSLAISSAGSMGRAIGRRLTVPVVPGRKYEVSYWYKTTADANGVSGNQKLRIGQTNGTLINALGWDGASTEWSQKSQIYTVGTNIFEWSITLTASHTVGTVWWDDISIVDVTDREVTASQITQLSDTINLKVSKDDVVNQINISTDGVLIAGNKVQITGQTYIENGVIGRAQIANLAVGTAQIADAAITDAKIGSLSATKITTGTLNAANVNIVNLNASSISTGELTGINIRAATFYGSSGSGNMQLNGVDLRFDTSSNSFRLNYNGIVNVNTSYGTRALAFFNEGINIAASSSNSGNFRNSGLTLSGDSTYVDFYSIGSTSANGRLLYSGNSMTLNNFRTGKRISLANNFDLYVSSLNVHKTNDSDWSGVYAASFTNSSERRLKTNLVLLKDSLSVLQKMKFYEYDRIDTLQHQLGPVLDEAPEKIIQGQGIDQYSFITLVATSLQEHAKKTSQDIDMLALRIDNLQNEFNQLRNAS
ncbi:hypothetical protein G8B51_02505 [Enterococcus casseliflavus]|uniref:carbohydrate binding domain-containing protein n=1 Tax=Enterococcus casseliflavus TaxID=37734 RepID=UPI00188448DA|nr:carbohydrate binding domain-containing protein [Enterococcus casseliflavus]MBE9878404.1 hypothetical protein [Enterococcus casseliflavus]